MAKNKIINEEAEVTAIDPQHEGRRGSDFRTVRVPAVKGTVNADGERLSIYTAEIPASVVADFKVERALEVEGGFQRALDRPRARKIGILMAGDEKKGIPPAPHVQSGLLAYGTEEDVSYSETTRMLVIRKPLTLIDGQTRAGGDAWAQDHGIVKDYTESVRVVVGATHEELVRWYLITNMTGHKVPPQNVLLNIATLEGVHNNRKSWVARTMVNLSTQSPFTMQDDETFHRLVSFQRGDDGQISAYTLYKAINFMLPDDLNKEGPEVEKKALAYCRQAFKLYASIYEDVWGRVGEDGKLLHHDCYEFTLMVAFARFYKAARAHNAKDAADLVRRTWTNCRYDRGLPEGTGSGERAAFSLASYAAGEAEIGPLAAVTA